MTTMVTLGSMTTTTSKYHYHHDEKLDNHDVMFDDHHGSWGHPRLKIQKLAIRPLRSKKCKLGLN